ncbi:MAG: response regulator [Clostridiaceae bacterium]|nr:response regulator [Clostridiaceae bacterium]
MLRIMVVDDESIVIESIKYIIEKNFKDVMLAGVAHSGREAIEKAETIKPDIIFMDIKMPGINGIDAIKEIKEVLPNVQFIILSACEQFEYAKEAVNLGVSEYLLKPVNRSKLIEIIRQAAINHEEAKARRKRELDLKEKYEQVLPILEHGLIYAILLNEDYNEQIKNYKRILDITEEKGFIITFEIGEGRENGNIIGSSVLSQNFYHKMRDVIKSELNCVVGPAMLNRIIVYVPVSADKDDYQVRLETVKTTESILDKLTQKIKTGIRVGIGSTKSDNENLLISFSESLKALKYANDREIIHIDDIPEEQQLPDTDYIEKRIKMLLESASSGDTKESIAIFIQIFDELCENSKNSTEIIKGRLLELIVMLHRLANDYQIEGNEMFQNNDYLREYLSIDDKQIIKRWCIRRIEAITGGIKNAKTSRCHHLATAAKEYIDKHYNEEISLEDVSRAVNLSPQYFSRFFKQETGENFIDYLTQVRINKAIELLKDKNHSIKEVCFMIGYNDPNYFSRIFKKVTGYSPSEQRN